MQSLLPKTFSKYFWDTKPESISLDKHSTYIIERLLEFGDIEELEWINKIYTREQILNTLRTSRRISPKTGNFFALFYGIPKESLECMKKSFI